MIQKSRRIIHLHLHRGGKLLQRQAHVQLSLRLRATNDSIPCSAPASVRTAFHTTTAYARQGAQGTCLSHLHLSANAIV